MSFKKKLKQRLNEEMPFKYAYEKAAYGAGLVPPYRRKPTKYEPLHRKVAKAILIPLGVAVLVIGAIPVTFIIASIRTEQSFNRTNRAFDIEDYQAAAGTTLVALNNIQYSENDPEHDIDEPFLSSINSFSSNLFLNQTKEGSSMMYSPLGLYGNLDLISLATSRKDIFSGVFGEELSEDERAEGIRKSFNNNYFIKKWSTVRSKQAVFMTNKYQYSQDFVDGLSKRMAEAYQGDFSSSNVQQAILGWATQYGDSYGLDANDLLLNDPYSNLLFMSLFYFDSYWSDRFKEEDTAVDKFYTIEGEEKEVSFMNHVSRGLLETYDEGYVSFRDYYMSGNSIEYYVPNETSSSILEIASSLAERGIDMFTRTNLTEEDNEYDYYEYVDLYVPKFTRSLTVDFEDSLSSMGLSSLFDSGNPILDQAFTDEGSESYVVGVKQTNKITFNEDGTEVTSLTISLGAGSAAPLPGGGYEVRLNQPYIYVIRDAQGVPVFMGYESDPSK